MFNNNKKIIFLVPLLMFYIKSSGMEHITSKENVTKFFGKVVACKSTSYYINNGRNIYQLYPESEIFYSVPYPADSDEPAICCHLSRIIKKEAVASSCLIYNNFVTELGYVNRFENRLKDINLFMRFLNLDEIKGLLNAIKQGLAEVGSFYLTDKTIAILEKQLEE